jgi:sugar O-acyltransferase (sialic acid O-acetyltransferase NeuD family)
MKNLLIIGAGGMGREIYDLATLCSGYNKDYVIKGFLDNSIDALKTFNGYSPVISTIDNYIIEDDDVFICSLGNVSEKKKNIQLILDKGGKFINLVHPDAYIGKNTKIGSGCILLKNAYVGVDCVIDDYVLIQLSAVIGHDVKVGKYTRVDNFVVCVGGTELKEEVTVHTSSVINHKVIVERNSIVGACSFVIRKVKENSIVYGNPAKKIN